MNIFNFKNYFITLFIFALMSCQPGAPLVTVLAQISGFELSETTQILKSKTNKTPFYISGKCNPSISDIEISFDNGATFSSLSQIAESYTKECATNGTFSFRVNPANSALFDIPASAAYKDFKIRGMGDFGPTSILNLRRLVTSSGDLQLTVGSTLVNASVSGTPVVLRARIVSSVGASSGTNFKFKGAIRIK